MALLLSWEAQVMSCVGRYHQKSSIIYLDWEHTTGYHTKLIILWDRFYCFGILHLYWIVHQSVFCWLVKIRNINQLIKISLAPLQGPYSEDNTQRRSRSSPSGKRWSSSFFSSWWNWEQVQLRNGSSLSQSRRIAPPSHHGQRSAVHGRLQPVREDSGQ